MLLMLHLGGLGQHEHYILFLYFFNLQLLISKQEFDKVYGPTWHCIVGTSFGSFVTHSRGCFLYFSMDKIIVMLFKTKIRKVLAS